MHKLQLADFSNELCDKLFKRTLNDTITRWNDACGTEFESSKVTCKVRTKVALLIILRNEMVYLVTGNKY